MSKPGIKRAAEVFSVLQAAHHDLLAMGCKGMNPSKADGQQDILLGKLFERANDLLKDDFMRIVEGKMLSMEPFPQRGIEPVASL